MLLLLVRTQMYAKVAIASSDTSSTHVVWEPTRITVLPIAQ